MREKLIESHHSERMILRRARDEAMFAPEVTKSAGDLEPESIQMIKLLCWIVGSHHLSERMEAITRRPHSC
jgi:hypothetical protein